MDPASRIDFSKFRICEPADIRGAARALAAAAMELGGFRVATCANIASNKPMVDAQGAVLASEVFGWTREHGWWSKRDLALKSPIPRVCRYTSQPVWANVHGLWGGARSRYLDGFDFSDLGNFIDFGAIIIVPVHMPFGQVGVVTFSRADEGTNLSEDFERLRDTMLLMAQIFITSYVEATSRSRQIPVNCELTRRESQCLRWAAAGKTDAEIAELISRTHGTVRFHLQNCGSKLNAVTRTQAVFKAAQLGFIGGPG